VPGLENDASGRAGNAEPTEPALGQRRLVGCEVACDGLGVRPRDAARVRAEALLRDRPEVLAIRVEECWRPTCRAELKNASPIPTETSSTLVRSRRATSSRRASGSYSPSTAAGADTPPTSSIVRRRRFFAIAS
jgi:hypothetical protein